MAPKPSVPRGLCALLRKAGFSRTLIATRTTHAVNSGYLDQMDLPVRPARLVAVRAVKANWPRIAENWPIVYGPVKFRVMLPPGLEPGTVVEWADAPDGYDNRHYTVVAAAGSRSLTFLHTGNGAASALEAARTANQLREYLAASGWSRPA